MKICVIYWVLASIFCLIFALETSYTVSGLPFASEVIAQSLESLVINMDSCTQTSGRNLNQTEYQLRDYYLDVLLRFH